MSQDEVLKILKKNGDWMGIKEINSQKNSPEMASLNKNLRKLYDHRDVLRRKSKNKGKKPQYEYKYNK